VEAFVGFPSQRKLREGDVFLLKDGHKLHNKYKPIERKKAKIVHILKPWIESIELARTEIKKVYAKLTVVRMSETDKNQEKLRKKVDEKFRSEKLVNSKKGEA
jgi:DNA gyrase/topoisomerase IV subunit A